MVLRILLLGYHLLVLCPMAALGEVTTTVLLDSMVHLRNGADREWNDFSEVANGEKWDVPFQARANDREYCLVLDQMNVKQDGASASMANV